jgi:hypothetical protein
MRLNRYFCTSVFFCFLSLKVIAQADLEYKRISTYFPGHPAVLIKNNEDVNIEVAEGKLHITSDTYIERMLVDNRAGMYSEESVDYSNLEKITKIEAGTFTPKKNKYVVTKIKEFITTDKISKTVFYDGHKNISFTYPSLDAGSKTYLKYTTNISEPHLFGSFFFQKNIPSVDAEFSITISNDIEIDWHLFNSPDSIVEFSKTTNKNNKTTYSWKAHHNPEYHMEEEAPGLRYSTPHIVAWVKSYKVNGQVYPYLLSPKDLYQWYYSITKHVNNEHSKELQFLADSLTTGLTNELDKVRKIYYWVQDNIKYIAVEDGMAGFVPRSGKTVCEKRYGDCKDMASIIYKMLSCAGIPSHLTWIGSRSLPYTYGETPSPAVDNHMITTYINNGVYYFLDATGECVPIDLPTAFIQGKEALIGFDSVKFEIRKVSEIAYDKNQLVDSVEISIDNNKINGKGVSYLSGFFHVSLAETISDKPKEATKMLRGFFRKGSNKFLIDSIHIDHLNERDKDLKISYEFNIEDYVRRNADDIYLNLNLDREFQNDNIEASRMLDIEKKYKQLLVTVVKIEIPKGYKVGYMPENAIFKNDLFGFEIQYQQTGKVITQTKKIMLNTLMIKKDDFGYWNKMVKELKKAYSEILILKKI